MFFFLEHDSFFFLKWFVLLTNTFTLFGYLNSHGPFLSFF